MWVSEVSAYTCYKSDKAVLGSANILTNNVLTCAEKLAKEGGGSATTCMEEKYPAYAAVSETCLLCTNEVMSSQPALECLANCIDDLTSSACTTCAPTLASAWTELCDKDMTAPTENSSADIPTCSASDISVIPSAASFVTGSLNCLKDLGTLSTCLNTAVPYYANVTAECKICAEAQTTSEGITADGCGAICMQEPTTSSECEKCGNSLSQSFNTNCLGGTKSSAASLSVATIISIFMVTSVTVFI